MNARDALAPYLKFVRAHYDGRDPGHDFDHIQRIVRRAALLQDGLEPPARSHILWFIAAFHGLAARLKDDSVFRAETQVFLATLDWAASEVADALDQLKKHLSAPMSTEQKIVHDANYAEVVGAFGIAKAFTVGGHHGQSYRETISIFRGNIERTMFQTPSGQRLYEPRRAYALAFLKDLETEL